MKYYWKTVSIWWVLFFAAMLSVTIKNRYPYPGREFFTESVVAGIILIAVGAIIEIVKSKTHG